MRLILFLVTLGLVLTALYLSVDMTAATRWAAEHQRGFQNQMAGAIRALRSGDSGALTALLAAAGAYGFVHAVGPGHGKFLIGGVGLGTSVRTSRLVGIAIASSLAQSLWAIALVYGGFSLLAVSARRVTALAEDIFAPASYLAIAAVGLVLVWRGVGSLSRRVHTAQNDAHDHAHDHAHADGDCGCHAHGPTPDEVAKLGSFKEAMILIASIAIRPCTGAIFLLVIAWQMDIRIAGAAAVAVMGLGTALLTSLVAISSIAARGITWASANGAGALAVALPALQTVAGAVIVWLSLILASATLF